MEEFDGFFARLQQATVNALVLMGACICAGFVPAMRATPHLDTRRCGDHNLALLRPPASLPLP